MISIIVPTLNEEKTIEEMLTQFTDDLIKRYDIELIVSDGGSNDQTLDIAKRKVHTILLHTNNSEETIGKGRNRGAQHSSGEFLFFFDADVRVESLEEYISVMLDALRSPGVVAATCPVYVYPEEQNLLDIIYHRLHNFHVWFLNWVGFGTGRGECHVVKRDEFFLTGGYNEKLVAGEDFDLYRRLAARGKIEYVRDLRVFESPRRYRRMGYARVTLFWLLNALSIVFFRRSFSKRWDPVR